MWQATPPKSLTERQQQSYSYENLLARFERAQSLNDLILCAEEAKTAPEEDKTKLREVYRRKIQDLEKSK